MLDPIALFSYEDHVDQRRVHARTLVVTLGSFVDAGHSQQMINQHLMNSLPNHLLGHFDVDQLIDYADHRPSILFDRDHLSRYEKPAIELRQVTDDAGTDFLLLSGPEPSLQWERMAATVEHLIDQFDVEQTVLLQAMPAPAPHTRPVAITPFANDPDLLPEHNPMLGAFHMSSSFTSMLTVRLGEAGHHVVGLLAHVPHYVAEMEYPPASLALLNELSRYSSLRLPTTGLEVSSAATMNSVNEQVESSEEVQAVVHQLEEQYDNFMEGRRRVTAEAEDLPSGDELAQEFEEFLKNVEQRPDEGEGPAEPDDGAAN
ncbi:proteasome assembly chaperone family protein [Nigerium massiliense]|uniref:proteasome assembly chaperone family protein n=1 Tax=Nigerium massiliense TaxID=1522317 RepID=UPI000590CB82|nr:PAC2 family protein [Nigerium massiliense]